MNLKDHILLALREQFERWDALLNSLSVVQITAPRFAENWSIQDVLTHLWGWQQISLARVEAAAQQREPQYPDWLVAQREDWEEDANQTNAVMYARFHDTAWPDLYQRWRSGFLQLLEAGRPIEERDWLDDGRYPWLKGFPLVLIYLASYDHHQEHLEKVQAALKASE